MIILLLACAAEDDEKSGPDLPRKALVIGVDGVRPDALQAADTPNFDRFAHTSLTATTHLNGPTVSGPGWASILTGVGPDKHLVLSNGVYEGMNRDYPTLIQAASDAGLGTAMSVHWPDVVHGLTEPDAADVAELDTDEGVTRRMVGHIESGDYDLHFVHIDDVDGTGHSTGFTKDNPDYIDIIEVVDGFVGQLLDAVDAREGEDWLVVSTTDHGGKGTQHGALDDANQTIYLSIDGKDDVDLTGASHLDVHPTVLTWLGVDPGEVDGVAR